MNRLWHDMAPADFARFHQLLGPRVHEVDGVHWVQVRRFFFRPLLPFLPLAPGRVKAPAAARLGGLQYPVEPGAQANSTINLVICDRTADYSLDSLAKNPRRQVRLAAKALQIRPIKDVDEFKRAAHPVYLSFQDRSGYTVGAERRDPAHFARWADRLFGVPGVLILGAYRQERLHGISISCRVGATVFYVTFFCDDLALELYLSDLMLHTVREAAAREPAIRRIFVGTAKDHAGLFDFYRYRGAQLVRQPARLELNPLAALLLRTLRPRQYSQLLGEYQHDPAPRRAATAAPPAGPAAD